MVEFSLTPCYYLCQNSDISYYNVTFANIEFTELHF